MADRYSKAAEQLGSDQAAVRLAGVYAMASLADDWEADRQSCVDVLCAYLRMPLDLSSDIGLPNGSRAEMQVRSAIIRVITSRVVPLRTHSWSECNFDFSRAGLPEIDFSGVQFEGDLDFTEAVFYGPAAFRHAKFPDKKMVSFVDAVFEGPADFEEAVVPMRVFFSRARFRSSASFRNAYFNGFIAPGVIFEGYAAFSNAIFRQAYFSNASFRDGAWFQSCAFNNSQFMHSSFVGPAYFDDSTGEGRGNFEGVHFGDRVSFHRCTLASGLDFAGSQWDALGPRLNDAAEPLP
jgi:uncharacterized protein YjbI with pentapeptide repeats